MDNRYGSGVKDENDGGGGLFEGKKKIQPNTNAQGS